MRTAGNMMPPKRQLERHKRELSRLIHGFCFGFPWRSYYVCVRLLWTVDDFPQIDSCRLLKSGSKESLIAGCLIDDSIGEDDDWPKVVTAIKRHPTFKKFHNRIKTLCREADKWEKKYDDYSWSSLLTSVTRT